MGKQTEAIDIAEDLGPIPNPEDSEDIRKEYEDYKKIIQKALNQLSAKQMKLNDYISNLEITVNNLNNMVEVVTDNKAKASIYGAISRNMELIAKFYDVYRTIEDTKQRYTATLGDVTYKYRRLIEIDIPSINKKLETLTSNEVLDTFKALSELLKSSPDKMQPDLQINDEKYDL